MIKVLLFEDRHDNLQVFEDTDIDVRDVLPDLVLRGEDSATFLKNVIYDLTTMDSPLCGFVVEVEIDENYFSTVKKAYQDSRKIMLEALTKVHD